MMVTTTVPDKLSVTSFVYQLYQYFTKARMSAIAKAEMEEAQANNAGIVLKYMREQDLEKGLGSPALGQSYWMEL